MKEFMKIYIFLTSYSTFSFGFFNYLSFKEKTYKNGEKIRYTLHSPLYKIMLKSFLCGITFPCSVPTMVIESFLPDEKRTILKKIFD